MIPVVGLISARQKIIDQMVERSSSSYCALAALLDYMGHSQRADGRFVIPEIHPKCSECPIYRDFMSFPVTSEELTRFELLEAEKLALSGRYNMDVGLGITRVFWTERTETRFGQAYGPWINNGCNIEDLFQKVFPKE